MARRGPQINRHCDSGGRAQRAPAKPSTTYTCLLACAKNSREPFITYRATYRPRTRTPSQISPPESALITIRSNRSTSRFGSVSLLYMHCSHRSTLTDQLENSLKGPHHCGLVHLGSARLSLQALPEEWAGQGGVLTRLFTRPGIWAWTLPPSPVGRSPELPWAITRSVSPSNSEPVTPAEHFTATTSFCAAPAGHSLCSS
jgi:hypothetical protein